MGALFRKPVTWLVIVFVCLPCFCLVTMPLWLTGGLYTLVPFANATRVRDVATHKYIVIGDVKVIKCGDEPNCSLEFEGQEALSVAKDEKYIEFTISNSAGQRLEEQFTITKVSYSNGLNAVCAYYPYPQVVGGQMSSVHCKYPDQVDHVCLTLDFPEVHPTLVGKDMQTTICRNIDGGN